MKVLKKIKTSTAIIILMLLTIGGLSAQSKIGIQVPPYKMPSIFNPNSSLYQVPDLQLDVAPHQIKTPYFAPAALMPPAFNSPLADKLLNAAAIFSRLDASNMPFFCKMEFQVEKASGFPLKFRLGDVQYVDMLEGKTEYIAPTW